MSHWFDTLARPHTRRTALKSAGIASAGVLLGFKRAPAAHADIDEPCYLPCLQLSLATREGQDEACDKRYGHTGDGEYVPYIGGLRYLLRNERYFRCHGLASTRFNEAKGRCFSQPECGDPARYPGGAGPTPAPGCGPGAKYVSCGDQPCCNLAYATCVSCQSGEVCCRIDGNCCG
jgi:hypothetical protein